MLRQLVYIASVVRVDTVNSVQPGLDVGASARNMRQIAAENSHATVIIGPNKSVSLHELLPFSWDPETQR